MPSSIQSAPPPANPARNVCNNMHRQMATVTRLLTQLLLIDPTSTPFHIAPAIQVDRRALWREPSMRSMQRRLSLI